MVSQSSSYLLRCDESISSPLTTHGHRPERDIREEEEEGKKRGKKKRRQRETVKEERVHQRVQETVGEICMQEYVVIPLGR